MLVQALLKLTSLLSITTAITVKYNEMLEQKGDGMQKWADYLISGVKSIRGSNRISYAEVHSDFGCLVCETTVESREQVMANIKRGISYATVFRTTLGKWRRGEDVRVVTVNGEEYLRTDAKPEAGDNFNDAPEI